VARRSGVSIATVSRVLNGTARVSDEARERVLAEAAALEYVPSAAARTLVTRRSQILGIVLNTGDDHPDIGHPFFQDVLAGLKHEAGDLGYDLLVFAAYRPKEFLRRALHHRVDGLILMGVDRHEPELARLLERRIPAVAVDLDVTGERVGFVTSDNVAGARLAVRHLHALGHRRIATVTGPPRLPPGGDRLQGYRGELVALGIGEREDDVREGDFYAESGYREGQALLGVADRPSAVFAASDMMALGVIRAARQLGLSVPGDLAVVGFDDAPLAAHADPPLTTVRQDKFGIGGAAATALVGMIESEAAPPPALVLPVELVVRRSCGATLTGE
jgi:LacI family transcriptional regulator